MSEHITPEAIDSYIRVFKELAYPRESWDMAEKDGVVIRLRQCAIHIRHLQECNSNLGAELQKSISELRQWQEIANGYKNLQSKYDRLKEKAGVLCNELKADGMHGDLLCDLERELREK